MYPHNQRSKNVHNPYLKSNGTALVTPATVSKAASRPLGGSGGSEVSKLRSILMEDGMNLTPSQAPPVHHHITINGLIVPPHSFFIFGRTHLAAYVSST